MHLYAEEMRGVVLQTLGRLNEAIQVFQNIAQLAPAIFGIGSNEHRRFRRYIAECYSAQNKLGAAEEIFRQILWRNPEALEDSNLREHCRALGKLSAVLIDTDRADEAFDICRQAYHLNRSRFGLDDSETGSCLKDLGELQLAQQKFQDAEISFRSALDTLSRSLGENHGKTLRVKYQLAGCLMDQQKYSESESILREIIPKQTLIYGPENPLHTLPSRKLLALTVGNQHRFKEATDMLRDVLSGFERTLGVDHPSTRVTREFIDIYAHANPYARSYEIPFRVTYSRP
jgi:tetratricopeptide (TPR) repeat protein